MHHFFIKKLKQSLMPQSKIREIQRKLRSKLSFLFEKEEKNSKKEIELINEIYTYAKDFHDKNVNKKKTHIIFSRKVFNLILSKKLLNFLQISFIQQMFFVHNRFFLLSYLREMYYSKKWAFWKKILKENTIGNPVRYFLYPSTSGNKIFQNYHLKVFEDFSNLNINNLDIVFEFGGGFGNLANTFHKINKKTKYIIFDTYEVNLLQYYYLKKNNLKPSFNKFDKDNRIYLTNSLDSLKKKINLIKSHKKKLFIANWSLSETPLSFRKKFNFIIDLFDYQLISFQNKFEEIDNLKYFKKIQKRNLLLKRDCILHPVKKIKNNYYLLSRR